MKRKFISLVAGAVLLSPIVGTISETTNITHSNTAQAKQKYPSPPGSSAKPFQPHYKKVGTKTKVVSIKEQKRKDAVKQLGIMAASSIASYGGAVTASKVISALGGSSTVATALFGGSNKTKFPIKLVITKYKQTNKKIQNRNAGYMIVKAYNKNTGKHLQTKKMFIVKKGA
ncbi:hypothetical protein [Staphylococcus shinii]|uniref:hypothetical protein n=2 Tax=Staphylococcus shinii TaxID=2912228 RepID=UPI00192DB6C8|nr:hypothetical protein [Staphylococcus shinii]QRA18114.1 hypothetical protein JMB28_14135 [Staphylococcus shinii]